MAAAKRMTKAQIVGEIADRTGLTKREVNAVFEALKELIKRELGGRGLWQERTSKDGKVVRWKDFVIPDLVKLKLTEVPEQKGKTVRNPGTGEVKVVDVPQHQKLRATPVKKLKDLVL